MSKTHKHKWHHYSGCLTGTKYRMCLAGCGAYYEQTKRGKWIPVNSGPPFYMKKREQK